MENQKNLIDEKTVESIRKSNTFGFAFTVISFVLTIVLGLILIPYPGNLFIALVCGGLLLIIIILVVKHGKLNVYFKEISVTDKWDRYYTSDGGDSTVKYYLVFGKRSKEVPEEVYDKATIGDRFYASYDAHNNHMIEIYDVNEYELSPTLDIR